MKKEDLFQETIKTSFLITEAIARKDYKEASNLRLLLNAQIDTLLKLRQEKKV